MKITFWVWQFFRRWRNRPNISY